MSHIVVAGGAGFLGSHMCDHLIARGDTVTCLDDLSTGTRDNVAHLIGHERFELVVTDVSEKLELDSAPAIDAVANLASPASPPAYLARPFDTLAVGSEGTRRLLELARAHDARFLMASTSEIYGDPEVHPQVESYRGNVDPTGPRSVYDEAKRFSESLTMAMHRTYGVNVGIARIFNTYGPRLSPADGRVVSNFIAQALRGEPLTVYGDGSQTRSLCYVDDEIAGLIALLDSVHTGPMNIGNPDERTVLEIAGLVLEVTGSSSEITYQPLPTDDPTRRCPDITLARQAVELVTFDRCPHRDRPHRRVSGTYRDALMTDPALDHDTPPGRSYSTLCVITPVYNERTTVAEIIRRMRAVELPLFLQVIVVDDGSSDGTDKVLKALEDSTVRVMTHPENRGKGAAIRTALEACRGDLVLIQDADLEYDPDDWPRLLDPILKGKARVVYGSRFTGERKNMLPLHWFGNRFLSLLTNVLYSSTLSDMETCYKLFDAQVLEGMTLVSDRFDFEPEVTAKVLRRGHRIYEVPISYAGREMHEGKKITWRDGVTALTALVRFRFTKEF